MAEQNNNYQQNKVTTSGLTLFDENGIMLRLAYLDESFSIMIGEPKIADNGKRTYPQETRYPFILTIDRAAALYDEIIMFEFISLCSVQDPSVALLRTPKLAHSFREPQPLPRG